MRQFRDHRTRVSIASRARSIRIDVEARYPTLRREDASIRQATYAKPRNVATYVKTATHTAFELSAVNARGNRSSGHGAVRPATVVHIGGPRTAPRRRSGHTNQAIVPRGEGIVWTCSGFHTFFTPSTHRFACHTGSFSEHSMAPTLARAQDPPHAPSLRIRSME